VEQKGLDQLNQYLLLNGKSLKDFPNIHLLLENMPEISNNTSRKRTIRPKFDQVEYRSNGDLIGVKLKSNTLAQLDRQ
jgi:hypothetical protein